MIIAETMMIKFPESCYGCDLYQTNKCECSAKQIMFGENDINWLLSRRPDWCPLVEVEMKNVKVVED